MEMNEIESKLNDLRVLIKENNEDKETIKNTMKKIVPTYKEREEVTEEEKVELHDIEETKTSITKTIIKAGKKVVSLESVKEEATA